MPQDWKLSTWSIVILLIVSCMNPYISGRRTGAKMDSRSAVMNYSSNITSIISSSAAANLAKFSVQNKKKLLFSCRVQKKAVLLQPLFNREKCFSRKMATLAEFGKLSEWSKEPHSKCGVPITWYRGFESLTFRKASTLGNRSDAKQENESHMALIFICASGA